jgi:hypothetical protein
VCGQVACLLPNGSVLVMRLLLLHALTTGGADTAVRLR